MSREYDVIIIGARCAGAPTAMVLASKGYRVLLLDWATFPSDTISMHIVHPPGVASLKRWGLLDRLASTGCPPITSYSFDFGPIKIVGSCSRMTACHMPTARDARCWTICWSRPLSPPEPSYASASRWRRS